MAVLGMLADEARVDADTYTDSSVKLGLDLGEVVIAQAPEEIYICFRSLTPYYERVPLDFSVPASTPLGPQLAALDTQLKTPGPHVPLRMQPELLDRATDMAMLLAVSRSEFIMSSYFFMQHTLRTVRAAHPVLLQDSHGELYPIEIDLG